jgi:hypothetical protein
MLLSDVLITSIVTALLQTVPLKLPAFWGRSIVSASSGMLHHLGKIQVSP